jgi:hypothetical protein
MMDNRSTASLLTAAVILSAILGLSYGATFNGGCESIKDAPLGCTEWWLSRYQTSIAIAGAIFAAWLGIQPVLKQLRLTSLQTAATLQQVHSVRERLLDNMSKTELARLEKLSTELQQGYQLREDEPKVLPHWIWDFNQEVDRVEAGLKRRQLRNVDGDRVTIARQNLISKLAELSVCMRNFNATVGADEGEWGNEDLSAAEDAELRAAKELPDRIAETVEAIDRLRDAFTGDQQELRSKRQLYDQILVNADIPRDN